MKLEDFIKAAERPLVKDEVREITLSHIHEHFRAGHFTPDQVLEYYRQRDTPKWIELVKKFEAGKLFIAQMQSFESWSFGDYAKEDKAAAQNYLSLEDAAMMRKAEGTPESIRLFIFNRVYGKRGDPSNEDKFKQDWIKQNARLNWRWNS